MHGLRSKLRNRFGLALLGIVVMAALMPTGSHVFAQAAPTFNLTASPLPINLTTKPGVSISTPLQIENSSTQPVRIKVTLQKFNSNGSGGKPTIVPPTKTDESVNWVHFSQTSFEAQPNVFNTVTMTISPPKTAAFGYYYAVIFSIDNSGVKVGAHQNAINGSLASLVLLDVNAPGEKKQLSVTNFSASKKVYQFLPATFNVTVKNTGNVHVIPSGNIYIHKSGSNTDIDILDVNKSQGNILPDSNRLYQASWTDGYPAYQVKRQNGQIISDKQGKPIEQLSWDTGKLSKFRFGRYTAHLTLVYNNGSIDVPLEADTSFWVIPWELILIVLIPIVAILFGLFVMIRSFYRGTRKQTKKLKKLKKKDKKTPNDSNTSDTPKKS